MSQLRIIIFRRGSGLLTLTARGGSEGASSTTKSHTLAVTVNGSGSVTSSTGAMDRANSCSVQLAESTSVTPTSTCCTQRMKRTLLVIASAIVAMAATPKAFAFGAVLQYDGQVNDRVAYFADVRYLLNKTPPDQLGVGVEIREIPVTAVYEHASKPEFDHMKLQFQCPSGYTLDRTEPKLSENKNFVRAGNNGQFDTFKSRREEPAVAAYRLST